MPSEGARFYKYLVVYPFNVLSIGKTAIIILTIVSIYGWDLDRRKTGGNFLLVLYDLLATAIATISLWFIVQKFYWRKVELIFNLAGIVLSISSIFTSFALTFSPFCLQTLSHLLTLILWTFSALWTWKETFDNVSNLFISEWGQGTDDTEIEYLEQHF